MRVSVILPVYNKAPWLREAMDSILTQSYRDFELIAVDDASTDASVEVLRTYSADPRLRIIYHEHNLGPGMTAQHAIDEAVGEFIVRMDADDVMLADRIDRQVAFMDAHPEVGISGGGALLFGEEEGIRSALTTDASCRAALLFGVPVLQPASIMRRSMLLRSQVRYEAHWPHVAEDWLFLIALMPHTRFGNITDPLVRYRKGVQNISHREGSYEVRKRTARLALELFGIAATDREAELHMVPGDTDRLPVDKDLVRDMRAWLDKLHGHFAGDERFDPSALKAKLDEVWDRLFYRLADAGPGLALMHMRSGGGPTLRQLYYLCRTLGRGLPFG